MKGKRNGMKHKEERIKSTAHRQLHHRHTTKMNDSKTQAEADGDSSIDSASKREKQLFLTSKKYIFHKKSTTKKRSNYFFGNNLGFLGGEF